MTLQKILDKARDELFSHVNRCGVLHAAPEDQEQWMDETIEYLGERFPDLTDGDLKDLYAVGIRFCQPAIPHGNRLTDVVEDTATTEATDPSDAVEPSEVTEEAEPATAGVAEETGSAA